MDRSKALNSLAEAVELTKMLEELMTQPSSDRATNTMPGMRITVRTVREMISASHDVLARELVAAARMRMSSEETRNAPAAAIKGESAASAASIQNNTLTSAPRRDLRATLERATE